MRHTALNVLNNTIKQRKQLIGFVVEFAPYGFTKPTQYLWESKYESENK